MSAKNPSRWSLAGTVTAAFADKPLFAGVRPWLLRPLFWLQLLLGEWRANPSGTAVCSINTGSLASRIRATVAAVLFLAVAVVLIAFESDTWPVTAALAVAACLCLPLVRRSAAGIGPRRRLQSNRPAGPTVKVHTVASVEQGAGRALLEKLNIEADTRGWTMTLDAANEALVDYYAHLGYVGLGEAVQMPSGQRSLAMSRAPRSREAVRS